MLNFLKITEGAGGCGGEDEEMCHFAVNDRDVEFLVMWIKGEDVIER